MDMTDQKRSSSIILYLNVEELLDGAWSADRSLLPARSSKGPTLIPSIGDFDDVYQEVYEDFVRRFTATAKRLAHTLTPGLEVQVDAGQELLRAWHAGPSCSYGDPLFEATLEQTQLPTIADIVER